MTDGTFGIPVLSVDGDSIAETWEKSLIKLYDKGAMLSTQYDKPGDPPSVDATMLLTVKQPLSEPMIHRDMPGGFEDLQEYVLEVCDGIKDHCVRNPDDPNDTRWEYTYHQRLFGYDYETGYEAKGAGSGKIAQYPGLSVRKEWVYGLEFRCLDQIENMCQQLAKCFFTRRAQAITWKPWEDPFVSDPPCLQSLWTRILHDEQDVPRLSMNIRIRSNDAYKAGFMNIYAFIRLQEKIAKRVSEIAGTKIEMGRYCHLADSYHIYGFDMKEFEGRFLKAVRERTFEGRTMRYEDVKDIMDGAVPGILEKARKMGR